MDVELTRQELGPEMVGEIRLVTEEALANVVHHAFEERDSGERSITVELVVTVETVSVEICDDGTAVNPLDAPPPDLDAPLESRQIGGLGVHLIRSLTDEAHYTRREGRNILKLIKRRNP